MILYIPLLDLLHLASFYTSGWNSTFHCRALTHTRANGEARRGSVSEDSFFGDLSQRLAGSTSAALWRISKEDLQREPKEENEERDKKKRTQRGVLPKRQKEEISTLRLSTSALLTDSCALQCFTCFENTAYQDLLDIWKMTCVF